MFRRGSPPAQRISLLFSLARDNHFCAHRYTVEKISDIGTPHSDAAMTRGPANLRFVICAVDVNKAVSRIGIVIFHPIEPEDAGKNEIVIRREWIFWRKRNTATEDGTERNIGADLFRDAKFAERRLHAAGLGAETETRSRNGIADKHLVARDKIKTLL